MILREVIALVCSKKRYEYVVITLARQEEGKHVSNRAADFAGMCVLVCVYEVVAREELCRAVVMAVQHSTLKALLFFATQFRRASVSCGYLCAT